MYGADWSNHRLIDKRLKFFSLFMTLLFTSIILRLFWLQVMVHEYYRDLADKQHLSNTEILAKRGEIFARDHTNNEQTDLYPLATNKVYYEVYVNPAEISKPQNTVDSLAGALGLDATSIVERVQKVGDVYEPIKHKVTDKELEQVKKIDLPGIYWKEEVWRYYPDKEVGSHMLGFFGYQDNAKKGKYGLEGYWNDTLSGTSISAVVNRTGSGNVMALDSLGLDGGLDGSSLVLTIDRTIQYEACKQLDRAAITYGSRDGSLMIMEPKTGRILAMCNTPGYDPNDYNLVDDVKNYNNNAVYEAYEPGSVFKVLAMAIAIDDRKVTPATTYEDTGSVKFGDFEIKNADLLAHGTQTMTEVIEKSLNTGIIFATQGVSNSTFKKYMQDFGFGQKYDLHLDQISAGDITPLNNHGDINKATASYGQGVTATVLQITAAINALANGGLLMEPYIVEETIGATGERIKTEPKALRQVIRPETASQVAAMMVSAVDNGHTKKAGVEGYYIAGKTGTAQVPEKGVYTAKTIHTLVGFGPISNPKFTMVIKLYNPNAMYAESTAAPLFGSLAKFLINYYQVPPER